MNNAEKSHQIGQALGMLYDKLTYLEVELDSLRLKKQWEEAESVSFEIFLLQKRIAKAEQQAEI